MTAGRLLTALACFSAYSIDAKPWLLEYLAPRSPRGAARVIQGLLEQCGRVCDAPLGYPACEKLRAGLRRAVYRPYLIFFTLDKTGVRIERIVHGARDLPSLFKDRG